MPKRKASEADDAAVAPSEEKKPARGKGRPSLSDEEKAKRAALKELSSGRGRGRPKGSTNPPKRGIGRPRLTEKRPPKIPSGLGRGRPRLTEEEIAERIALKPPPSGKGPGRPVGSFKSKNKKKV